MNKDTNKYDEIARVAYGLYENRGQSHGYDIDDWVEAEKIVMKKYSKVTESDVRAVKSTQKMKAAEKTKSRNRSINL